MNYINQHSDYNGGLVSQKICKFILSYYHKVNEKIWYKNNLLNVIKKNKILLLGSLVCLGIILKKF